MNIHMAVHGVNAVGRFLGLCWYWVTFAWVLLRAIFFWWLFLVLVWDFTDLLGIPLIQDLKAGIHEAASIPGRFFTSARGGKEDPAAIQARCRHLTQRNGRWNHYCPLCGKKLLTAEPPRWRIE